MTMRHLVAISLLLFAKAFANPSFGELEGELVRAQGAAQSLVDEFLVSWRAEENLLGGQQVAQQKKISPNVRGNAIFRRACPLPDGGDCFSGDICCSGGDGAFCCGADSPTCCGQQGDGWCCPDSTTCCGHGCCSDGFTCCGTALGTGTCCGKDQICCQNGSFCCDQDQTCGDGKCKNPSTTTTITSTKTASGQGNGKTVTVTSTTTKTTTSTSDTVVATTTISNAPTGTVFVTVTKTISDSLSPAKRGGVGKPCPQTSAAAVTTSVPMPAPTAQESNELRGIVYLREDPGLDRVASLLMERAFGVERRDTDTITVTTTVTVTRGDTTKTSWITDFSTEIKLHKVTDTSFDHASTTVTSTTTTTTHVSATGDASRDGGSSSDNKGAIIGGAVGGGLGAIAIAAAIFFLCFRKRSSDKNGDYQLPPQQAMTATMYGGNGTQQAYSGYPQSNSTPSYYNQPREGQQSPYSNSGNANAFGQPPPQQTHEMDGIGRPIHEVE